MSSQDQLLFDSSELVSDSGKGFIDGFWHTPPESCLAYMRAAYLPGDVSSGTLFFQPSTLSWGRGYEKDRVSLRQLLRRGASTVVVDELPHAVPDGLSVLVVPDTSVALAQLAKGCRESFKGSVICVTGSVGKSTTTHGLAALLSHHAPTHVSQRNFNHYHGVLLSLVGTKKNSSYAVLEFSSDRPRYTLPKALIAQPDVSVFTDIQYDHTDCYPSLEAIADQKSLLNRALRPGGSVVVNRDSPLFPRLIAAARAESQCRLIGFGRSRYADIQLLSAKPSESGWLIKVRWLTRVITYSLSLRTPHDVMNSLAMLGALAALNIDPEPLLEVFDGLVSLPRHCETSEIILKGGLVRILDDSFSSNPASLRAALRYVDQCIGMGDGRRLLVLGSIAELGERSAELHRSLADMALFYGVERVYAYGSEMRYACEALPPDRIALYTKSAEELAERLLEDLAPGDLLILKFSRYSRLASVIKAALRRG